MAMEATGVYWIPLFQILEDRGFEVCLVNARHVKNVPGRKSDVQDCQWLQYLHSVGLLNASFRPPAAVCAVRSLVRHRESLMRTECEHLLHVQKALHQMNVQLHHAVTDITGVTGLAILDAIVAGKRDAKVLAAHKLACVLHPRIKHRSPYDPGRIGNPELGLARKERSLRRQAEQLGFTLIPAEEGQVS